jgi:voltage-gated potassium channel
MPMPEHSEILARRRHLEQRVRARHELRLAMRRLGLLLTAIGVLIVAGTAGFGLTEGTSLAYSFEWTLDTITTLGTIPDPHDAGGRVLKVGLELLGIGTLFYGLATVAEFFVSGQLSGVLEERRTQRMINSYTDHYIICGYGRVGRQVARDLNTAGVRYVVIDNNPHTRDAASAAGVPHIEREAADDETLQHAGIERARAVIACVDSDAENIFIALSARELRADILIIARASAEDSEKKLLRAGADRVISPYKISGSEMARSAVHPQVSRRVEVADYRMDEIEVLPHCAGVGRTIDDVRGTSMIVALWRTDGRLEPQPAPETVIAAGDKIVALGTPAALERLEGVFQPGGGAAE